MRRLVCAFVVRMQQSQMFTRRCPNKRCWYRLSTYIEITHNTIILSINICRVPRKLYKNEAECSNISRGTQQVLMKWNRHGWSLFLHNLPDANETPTENTAETSKYHLYYTGFLQTKWRQNVITSVQRHSTCNVSVNKNVDAINSPGRNAFPCK